MIIVYRYVKKYIGIMNVEWMHKIYNFGSPQLDIGDLLMITVELT